MEKKELTQPELNKMIREHCLDGKHINFNNCYIDGLSFSNFCCENPNNKLNLSSIEFTRSIIVDCRFDDCDLVGCDFSQSELINSVFVDCYMMETSFCDAKVKSEFYRIDFTQADFSYANLYNSSFKHCIFDNVIYDMQTAFFTLQCPEEGDFIGYKKCRDNVIVKLLITGKRSSATSRKCRCSEAKVLEISKDPWTGLVPPYAVSKYDFNFVYRVGETVSVPDFDENRWDECSTGIHFFITRHEAEMY